MREKDKIIEIFNGFDRNMFAKWLQAGLQSFYAVKPWERSCSFEHVGYQIAQSESLVTGLRDVYNEYISSQKKLEFRQAIGDVLLACGNDAELPLSLLQDLVCLISLTKAVETLDAISLTVGRGLLGKRHPEIWYDTMVAMASLPIIDAVYTTVLKFTYSENWDDAYLFEAVRILIECNPQKAFIIITIYEPRLRELREITEVLGGVEWELFSQAAEALAETVKKLVTKYCDWDELKKDLEVLKTPERNWLFELLFNK